MFATLTSFMLLSAGSGGGGFTEFYNTWFNIPGFEAWKFLNLAIFIAILAYVLKKPLSETFRATREKVRADLIKAEEERQAALSRLKAVETNLAGLEAEKETILGNAKAEAAAEKKRLAEQTKADIERMRQQMQSEVARLTGQSKAALRRFSAEESIRLAEEKLRSQIDDAASAKLVRGSISEIGGLN
ncbi:MAG: hypothetical protein IPM59_04440 [Chloracidobacterium sp.]|nr:hypothetical protein [Chloracidobacterium sp.]